MNSKLFSLFAIPTLLLTSCVSPHTETSTVGPPPMARGIGYLQVFSPSEEHEDSINPVFYRLHAGYSVFTPDGKQIKKMENYIDTSEDTTLDLVPLPAGNYLVKAKKTRFDVPVIVKPGQTTVVHLEGGWEPPKDSPAGELVKLPRNGFVGWRGDSPEASPK